MRPFARTHASIANCLSTATLTLAACIGLLCHPLSAPAQNGPIISYSAVLNHNGSPLFPSISENGAPLYKVTSGSGFTLVIEGRPGSLQQPVGASTYNAADPKLFPDLQVEVDQPLGDGSAAVCDATGGVAAIPTPSFDETPQNAAAINDFACRFVDSMGRKLGRGADDVCTFNSTTGEFGFLGISSVQFCASIDPLIQFHPGDTLVRFRLRDMGGAVSFVSSFIIEVPSVSSPTPTATSAPGGTASPTRTVTSIPTIPPTASATVTATETRTPLLPTTTPSPTPTRSTARVDIDAVIRAIFGEMPPAGFDVNGDGPVTAADVPDAVRMQ